jgi:uncharacterized coiled-coil DUF342 family protein
MATTDERPISEMRQEILEQVQDATALLGLVPRLIEENAALRAQAEAAAREVERVAREVDRAHAEVEPLRNEMARYRAERDELTEVLGKVMTEVSALINELGPRFRVGRSSPFARDREAPAPVPAEPTLRPPMTPVLATR